MEDRARRVEQIRNGVLGSLAAVCVVMTLNWSSREARTAISDGVPPAAQRALDARSIPLGIQQDRQSYIRAKRLAVQCQGHFERLSSEDQAFLNEVTFGHGREFVKSGRQSPLLHS